MGASKSGVQLFWKYSSEIFFILIAILFLTLEFWIFAPKNTLFSWDESVHGIEAWKYYIALNDRSLKEILEVSNYYPPLVGITTAILFTFFGVSENIARLTNMIYYIIMIISIFVASKYITKNKVAPIISIIFVSSIPLIIKHSKMYMLDLPLTAIIAVLLSYFTIKNDKHDSKKFWAVFGVIVGISLLVKWTGIVFGFALFLSSMIILSLQKKLSIKGFIKISLVYGIIVCVSIILVAGWWYIPKILFILQNKSYAIIKIKTYTGISSPKPFAVIHASIGEKYLSAIITYAKLLMQGMGIIWTSLFAISLVMYTTMKSIRDDICNKILIALLISYLILTIVPNKQARYFMPAYPFIVIFTSATLTNVISAIRSINVRISNIIMALIIIMGIIQMIVVSFPPNDSTGEKWQECIEEVVLIAKNASKDYSPFDVLVIPDKRYLNGVLLEFYAIKLKAYNVTFYNGVYEYFDAISANTKFNITNFDAILIIGPINHSETSNFYEILEKQLYDMFYENINKYRLYDKIPLPDGSTAYLYILKRNDS